MHFPVPLQVPTLINQGYDTEVVRTGQAHMMDQVQPPLALELLTRTGG